MTRLRQAGGSSSKPARRRDDPPGRGGRSAAGARAAAAARTWFVREPPRTGTPGPRPGSRSGGYSVRGSGRERESFWGPTRGPHVRPSGLGSQSVIPRSSSSSAAAAAMSAARGLIKSVSRAAFSWEPTGRAQQTLAAAVSRSGVGLHSGARATATLLPARAGEGRYFVVEGEEEARVAAEVGNAEPQSPLCTTLRSGNGAARVRTVEHLLSAMEALGVDNCRVEVSSGDEIPLLDGSAQEWVEAIRGAGLCAAEDISGQKLEKLAPKIDKPVYLRKDDCFVAAFPSSQIHITYGIDFPKVEKFRGAGLIKGGSLENAMVCSMTGGWLNPPLRFDDEPCRHKILDLIGDFSLFARNGSQGFPIAHVVAYKAGHALHTSFLHHLSGKTFVDQGTLA